MTLKERATAYHRAVSNYDTSTVEAMVHPDYIQHNPRLATGRAAFIAILPKLKEHHTKIENIRILEEGPFVVMHHRWRNAAPLGADEMAAFHIIRFDENNLIAEHWNVTAPLTTPNPSGRSQLDGEVRITETEKVRENKQQISGLITAWMKDGIQETDLGKYFYRDFRQHHPRVADGISGITEAIERGILPAQYDKHHTLFGEGNFILSISEGWNQGNRSALYDLFRLDRGKIAEHWSVHQTIPRENLANQNTMFNFPRQNWLPDTRL